MFIKKLDKLATKIKITEESKIIPIIERPKDFGKVLSFLRSRKPEKNHQYHNQSGPQGTKWMWTIGTPDLE